ncbi:hypothetical protein VSR68_37705 [Paraburkholderia phymatum]|uniref:hypothetical protein n=1 Tax=Paraburkholderia phymatum TaxID=148447 RepID=UPI003178C571
MAFVMQNASTAANGRELTRRRALCSIRTTLRQENRNFRCKRDETGHRKNASALRDGFSALSTCQKADMETTRAASVAARAFVEHAALRAQS